MKQILVKKSEFLTPNSGSKLLWSAPRDYVVPADYSTLHLDMAFKTSVEFISIEASTVPRLSRSHILSIGAEVDSSGVTVHILNLTGQAVSISKGDPLLYLSFHEIGIITQIAIETVKDPEPVAAIIPQTPVGKKTKKSSKRK
jgi:hypothetical protein